jgi:flavin-dependent dehydrogenase
VASLRDLGMLDAVEAAGPAHLGGWRLRAEDGTGFDGAFPAPLHALGIPRTILDTLLLDGARAAGVEVRTGTRVIDLLREGGGAAGVRAVGPDGDSVDVHARRGIGADGLRSVVVRRLGLLRRGPRLRKVALAAHVRGITSLGGRGELHLSAHGCAGVADVGDGTANVTVVAYGGEAARVRGDPGGYFDAALVRYGFSGAERTEAVVATGPFDWPVRSAISPGALLVGDASGYYDPFTGQGIYRALRGAEMSAEVCGEALRAGGVGTVPAAALLPYERDRRRAFVPGGRVQHLVEAFVSRPRLFGAVARRFSRNPGLGDAVIAVTGDLRPARTLLHPALLARLLW